MTTVPPVGVGHFEMKIIPFGCNEIGATFYLLTLICSSLSAQSDNDCDGQLCHESATFPVPIQSTEENYVYEHEGNVHKLDPENFRIHSMDFINQVLLRMKDTNSTHFDVNKTVSSTRNKRDALPDLVRVKIQAFVFDVKNIRGNEKSSAAQHLRQLMKPFQHLLLDPQYSENTITTYNPYAMQYQVCKQFEGSNTNTHMTNSIFVVNDMGAWIDRPLHDRLHRLFFQITSALGIPSITWLPNRVGQLELDESQLTIRLEPLAWHVSHALVDFMQAYNWNIAILVYNTLVPGSTVLVEEIRKRRQERLSQDDPEVFEFDVIHEFQFEGLPATAFTQCVASTENLHPCVRPLLEILERIWRADARVIVFIGNIYDLHTLLYIADSLDGTEYAHLKVLFDVGYVWIFTPSTMSTLTVADNKDKASSDNNVLQEFTMFRRIPGMFGFVCLNDLERRKQSAELAREIWQKAMIELVYQLTQIYPPETPVQTNTMNTATLAYFKQILEKLRPEKLCHDSEHLAWQWGRRMYDIMRSLTFTFNNEPISFLPNGGLNTSELYVYNSQISDGQMKWRKVGTWSMKSKWGQGKSRLRIDGVTWPGGANSPPKGRPSKFKLRVVTIKERPFVIYNRQQDDGTCDANSLPCRLRPQSIAHMDPPKQESGSNRVSHLYRSDDVSEPKARKLGPTDTLESNDNTSSTKNHTEYVNGCCTGLTMDLLMELMKDLNFDVDLFEVPDGLWGAWTPDGWNGLIRTLMDREADMAVTALKITPNRSQQVEFSVPFMETGIAVTVALREGAISPTAFLKPYDYQCWCLILVFSVHASGAALFLFEWLSPNGLDRGRMDASGYRFSLFRSFWLIWSMLFGAAVNADNPRGVASRFLVNIWALFALVFLASYTANLAAFMIAKEDYYDLSGMNDWRLQQPWNVKPPFRFATIPSGATEENIKINFPEMGAYMRKFNRSTVEEGLRALRSGELNAFIYDAHVLNYWVSRDEGCKLRIVGNLYAMTGYGIGFAKGNKWLEKVNSRILDYQKNGKLQRWKKFWQTGTCRKDAALGNTNKTLGVKNFISAFLLLLCGMLICSLILFLEHIVHRYLRAQLHRTMDAKLCSIIVAKQPRNDKEKNQYRSNKSHYCNDPQCLAEMKRLQMEAEQLRQKLEGLQRGKTKAMQNKVPFPSVEPHHNLSTSEHRSKPVPAILRAARSPSMVGFAENEITENKSARDSHFGSEWAGPDESRAERERKFNKPGSIRGSIRSSSRERSKLWDIYSKVAVIPIDTDSTPPKYSCGTHHSDKVAKLPADKDATIMIIPRLAASPKRRQPAIGSTSLPITDSNTALFSPKQSRKGAHVNGDRFVNSPSSGSSPKKERVRYITPTGSHVSIRRTKIGIDLKESVKSPPKVRVQDQAESSHKYGVSKQELPVLHDSHNGHHNDRPTEAKGRKWDYVSKQISTEPMTTINLRDQREKQFEVKKRRELRFEKTEPHLERVPRLPYSSTSMADDFNPNDSQNISKLSTTQTLVEKESVL